jgi:hypothetical protein
MKTIITPEHQVEGGRARWLSFMFGGVVAACLVVQAQPVPRDNPTAEKPAAKAEKTPVNPFNPDTIKVERDAIPYPTIKRVYLVSIDGCRPDILLRSECPNYRALTRRGAYTFWARSTALSITLPTHTSMLTGQRPRQHGIEWNRDLPFSEPVYPKVPTIFDILKRTPGGPTPTALIAGKSKFDTIAGRPGTVTHLWLAKSEKAEDDEVLPEILKGISAKPTFGFFHLPSTDNAGHKYGWNSKEQVAALENADKCVGLIVQAVKESGVENETLLIVTADHGGAGKAHGPEDARCRHVPWVAVGPGVRKDYDLNTDSDFELNVEDNFSTALWLLGVKPVGKVVGKPVAAIFEPPAELLVPATK